jgi:cytochrome P450
MTDPRFGMGGGRAFPNEDADRLAAILETFRKTHLDSAELLTMDPPEHTRIRRLAAGQFSIVKIAELSEQIEQIVTTRLDGMEMTGGPVDLVDVFARPIGLTTHCALLGVPEDDGPRFERLSVVLTDPSAAPAEVNRVLDEFREYLATVIAEKRAAPGGGVMSWVVNNGELTEDEIASFLVLIFVAGVDTTKSMLAMGPFALFCNPEQLHALQTDPALIDTAVDELMRYLTVFQVGAVTRVALEEVEIADDIIEQGQQVTVSLAAANRDPERFENPDTLDVNRKARGHLGFGHGVHTCLGQHLARLEMQIAFRGLLSRFPTLRLAAKLDELTFSGERDLILAPERLPVTW